jgi:hypothetical protein
VRDFMWSALAKGTNVGSLPLFHPDINPFDILKTEFVSAALPIPPETRELKTHVFHSSIEPATLSRSS